MTIFAYLKPLVLAQPLPFETPTAQLRSSGMFKQTLAARLQCLNGYYPRPGIQSQAAWRFPCGYGSLRRPVPNLVQAVNIRRRGFEQSGPYRRSRQVKGIHSVAVSHSCPVPSCDSRVRLQREAAAESEPIRQRKELSKGRPATNQSRKRKPEGSIRRRAGRFPPTAIWLRD